MLKQTISKRVQVEFSKMYESKFEKFEFVSIILFPIQNSLQISKFCRVCKSKNFELFMNNFGFEGKT